MRATERNTNHIVTSRNMVHNDIWDTIHGVGVDTASPKKFLDIADVCMMGLRVKFAFRLSFTTGHLADLLHIKQRSDCLLDYDAMRAICNTTSHNRQVGININQTCTVLDCFCDTQVVKDGLHFHG